MDINAFDRHVGQIRHILDSYCLFFVVGAPKSGTTWLQKVLDAHPEIVCAGEGHFVDKFGRDLAQIMKNYYRKQEVVTRNVYEGQGYYRHQAKDTLGFLTAAFVLKTFAHLDIPPGTRLIGDKTPNNVQNLDILRRLFPNARFVNVVRDGRDNLVSMIKHAQRVALRDGSISNIEDFVRSHTRGYALRWVSALDKAERFAAKHPGVLYNLRYEDLKHDFRSTVAGAFAFLGASVSDDILAGCERETSFKRLSGGREAGEEDLRSFYRKGIVGDWRTSLPPELLDIFLEVAADRLVRSGYAETVYEPVRDAG